VATKKKIQNCVSQYRTQVKVTQETLAEAVGVSRQTIIALEKGNYTPSLLLALEIAQFFNKPVEELFTLHYEK
jgi:putative transcriptional regulator